MNLEELNELDLNDIGEFPLVVKLILVSILCIGIGVAVYYYDIQEQFAKQDRAEAEERDLRQDFEIKQAKAVNLEKYKQQLEEMKETFGAMLRQLPDKTEVADLLVDVSQTGLAAGLEFELFQPQSEVPKEFYAELPISIKVHGQYHEFGEFISGLAALPRIVTIHDITITPLGGDRNSPTASQQLQLQATAKTYRYLDEDAGQ
ncbi:MAG: type 4a pilus biogenesis protein PilO [Chromatiales bacterium]|jgi:type IV pilus assembly protein PilO